MKISDFKELANIFEDFGYDLYLVGGSVRDYLLHSSFLDADCVSNASIEDIKRFLKIKSSATILYNIVGNSKGIQNFVERIRMHFPTRIAR